MNQHARYALAWPVHVPERDIRVGHYWRCGRRSSACLTVNVEADAWPILQFSVAFSDLKGPIPLLNWTGDLWNRASALAEYVLDPLGEGSFGEVRDPVMTITRQWRKRLSPEEAKQLSVRETQGHP